MTHNTPLDGSCIDKGDRLCDSNTPKSRTIDSETMTNELWSDRYIDSGDSSKVNESHISEEYDSQPSGRKDDRCQAEIGIQCELDKDAQCELDRDFQAELDRDVREELDRDVQEELDRDVQCELDGDIQCDIDSTRDDSMSDAGRAGPGTVVKRQLDGQNGTRGYVRALTDDSWYIHGSISAKTIEWLIDSGAGPSLLDYEVYLGIDPEGRPTLAEYSTDLLAAGGSQLNVYGQIVAEVQFGQVNFTIPLVVADLGGLQGILGNKFIRSAEDVMFDLRKGTMSVGSQICYLHERSGEDGHYVRLEQAIEIPGNHEVQVPARVSPNWTPNIYDRGLLERADDFCSRTGLVVPRTLVTVVDGQVLATLANFHDYPVSVEEGTIVGTLAPVESVRCISAHPVAARRPRSVEHLPEHLKPLIEQEQLTERQAGLLCDVVYRNQDLFAGPDGPLGHTDRVKHTIDTGDARPIKRPPRRFPATQQKVVEEEVEKMLKEGIIQESDSPWASQVVLVKKKDGSTRFCVDYRFVNGLTKKDAYPLPNITDCMDALRGATWFCTLDMASGYWQVEVDERDREKTAFATRKGLYEFRVMPFGLTNAPATFERLMEKVLRSLQWELCLVYLDDIILVGETFERALDNLETVFERLRAAGLKLKPKKCTLMKKKVAFLGHVVDGEGIHCDPTKIEAVRDWGTPSTVSEIRSFLGLASYYRRFVPKFSTVASPLTDLIKKDQKFEWTERCEEAFQLLKKKLIEAPVLVYPSRDDQDLFILDTDASNTGIGAVLSQVQDAQEKVISYASKTLSPSQRRYCVTYRELLAVVVFAKQFRHYLLGRKFKIRTDHASLRWLSKFKDAEGMVGRWITYLSTFDFELEHRRGSMHGNADALSRKPPRKFLLACRQNTCSECPPVTEDGIGTWNQENGVVAVEATGAAVCDGRSSIGMEAMTGDTLDGRSRKTEIVGTDLIPGTSRDQSFNPIIELGIPSSSEVQVNPENTARENHVPLADGGIQVDVTSDDSVGPEVQQEILVSITDRVTGVQTKLDAVHVCDAVQATLAEDREPDNDSESQGQIQASMSNTNTSRKKSPVRQCAKVMAVTDQNGGQPPDAINSNWVNEYSSADMERLQVRDAVVSKVRQWKVDDTRPSRQDLLAEGDPVRALCEQWTKLEIVEGVLYRKKIVRNNHRETVLYQLVAPQELRMKIFEHLHSSRTGGHLGVNRTVDHVRRRFYWPGSKTDVKTWCKRCDLCARVKTGPRYRAAMQHVPAGSCFDVLYMDILGELPETDRGNKYILVITDGFTKWTQAMALPDQTAQTVADALMIHVFSLFGVPRRIHTDQGRNFESNLFRELCDILGIEKSRTTPYRPQSDGQTERFNRTLQQMLKSYVNDERDDWDDHIPYVMMAYRATTHDSTNVSPNLIFLGRENVLPIDLVMGLPPGNEHPRCAVAYTEWVRRTTVAAHEFARKSLEKSTVRRKRNYDIRSKPTRYEPNEFVWRWYPPSANRKLGRGWVGPYRVVGCPSTLNCLLEKERNGRLVRVHIDHLKPYSGEDPHGWSDSDASDLDAGDRDDEDEAIDDEHDHDNAEAGLEHVADHTSLPADDDHLADSTPDDVRRSRRRRKPPNRLDL